MTFHGTKPQGECCIRGCSRDSVRECPHCGLGLCDECFCPGEAEAIRLARTERPSLRRSSPDGPRVA
jgi:hypothetical protein